MPSEDALLELQWAKHEWDQACQQIGQLALQAPPFGPDVFETIDVNLRELAQKYHDAHVKTEVTL